MGMFPTSAQRAAPDRGRGESPRPWGRSGAARRTRRAAFAAIATAVLSAGVAQASSGIGGKTFDLCTKALVFDATFASGLEGIGWTPFDRQLKKRFERRAIDGFGLLYSGESLFEIDWGDVLETGNSFTDHHLSRLAPGQNGAFVNGTNPTAVLFVTSLNSSKASGIECSYAGPADTVIDAVHNQLVKNFEERGLKQGNAEASIAYFSGRQAAPSGQEVDISVQTARFLGPNIPAWNRAPRVETAFFVTRETTK